jgi:hypothetical protein
MDNPELHFNYITDELTYITKYLSIDTIINLSLVNFRLNCCLWNNDLFWLSRLISEFGLVSGKNEEGNENNNKWSKTLDPSKAGSWRNLYFDSFNVWIIGKNTDSKLGIKDRNISQLTQIPNLKALQIKHSGDYTLTIDLNNNVYVWDYSESDQLELNNEINRQISILLPKIKARSISCNSYASFIIDSDDKLLGFGACESLGLANLFSIGSHISQPQVILPFKIKEVSSGGAFTIITDQEDRIWGWGSNLYGQLGNDKKILFNSYFINRYESEASFSRLLSYINY